MLGELPGASGRSHRLGAQVPALVRAAGRGAPILTESYFVNQLLLGIKQLPRLRSNVQAWVELSEGSDHLTDALIYAGRGEWFDVYKAIECLEDFAGGESKLKRKKWVKSADLSLMKRTANCFHRHRRGAVAPPENPMTLENARKMLANLIKCAFAELSARDV